MLRRLNALSRFLLERMDNPYPCSGSFSQRPFKGYVLKTNLPIGIFIVRQTPRAVTIRECPAPALCR